jgi:hypothetical protein
MSDQPEGSGAVAPTTVAPLTETSGSAAVAPASEVSSPPPTSNEGSPPPPPTEEQKKVAGEGGAVGGTEPKTGTGTEPNPKAPSDEMAKLVDALGKTVVKEGTDTVTKEGAGKAATGAATATGAGKVAKKPTKLPIKSKAQRGPTAPSASVSNNQNPQGGTGGMGGSGGMMGMMGVPMSSMSTNNVDLPFLKNKLIQELSAYNITDDRDMIISIIRSSDYIKELRRSLHQPTFFQDGVQDFIDGIQDKILKFPEKWKTEFTQSENTSTLNELFHNMLKKYKDSVDEGGDMNTTDLYSLYQISNNAQNCGSSSPPPPPHQSSNNPKGPSMLSKLKNAAAAATTRKNKPGDPAGTPGATPGATPEGTPKKGMLDSAKEKFNNLTRKLTPEEQEEAAKKKAAAAEAKKQKQDDAAAEKQKKKDADAVAKKQKQDAAAEAAAILADKVKSGNATASEQFDHQKNVTAAAMRKKASDLGDKISATGTAVKTGLSKAGTVVQTGLSTAGTSVKTGLSKAGTSISNAGTAIKDTALGAATNVLRRVGNNQAGGSGGASHHRTRYISDIKHNRRRLYDREREIIQSIRNFENNNNRKESRHHKTRKLRNMLMRR